MMNPIKENRKTKNIMCKLMIVLVLFEIGDFAIFHVLKAGMDRYYGLNKSAEILCIGYSHTVLGLDAERMEEELGVPVAKYALAGANTVDRFWMIRHFLENHPSVKMVIYDVDPTLFDSQRLSSASYTLFLPYINDPVISEYLFQKMTWQEYLTAKAIRLTRFQDQTITIALHGLMGKNESKKFTRIRIEDLQHRLALEKNKEINVNPESLKFFLETTEWLSRRNIDMILIYIPTLDLLNDIDPVNRENSIALFRKLGNTNEHIHFVDYNQAYQHRHELFYDHCHLNKWGNEIVTGRLITELKHDYGF